MKKKQGIFISLEGIDGCGKTTLCNALKQAFSHTGQPLTCLREPGGTQISEAVRQILLNPAYTAMAPETEALLYASARSQVCAEIIRPALEQGHLVLADRYTDSTLAYQGYGRGLSLDFLKTLSRLCTAGLQPGLTLLLDIDPKTAILRRSERSPRQDRLEQEGLCFQEKIRNGYLSLAAENPGRIILLDASLPKGQLLQQALLHIEKYCQERK